MSRSVSPLRMGPAQLTSEGINPFTRSRELRNAILEHIRVEPRIRYDGKGFICALINSRCHVGCEHCMFFSNMREGRNMFNTMSRERVKKLMDLVTASNTGYLLVSGGGEGFLELPLMCQIAEESTADLTWMVTSAFWAKKQSQAANVLAKLHDAYCLGKVKHPNKRVCVRVSVDEHHITRLATSAEDPFGYIANVISEFETKYAQNSDFFLQFHSIEGEEELIERLRERISATKISGASYIHNGAKKTEAAVRFRLPSGYEFDVTFAKLLLSDMAADLRDCELLEKRIRIWEKDALVNQHGRTAFQINPDGTVGTDMLVVYDGRVAGGWQSEMPDVPINLDVDSYDDIMRKTLFDPGVLATVERGVEYRFGIIDEVCPKASLRAKAVNIRDYTSPVLLEEDTVKLYYTLRATQDFISDGRINTKDVEKWPSELRDLVRSPPAELKALYDSSGYDVMRQFEETEEGFSDLSMALRAFSVDRDGAKLVMAARSACKGNLRRLDKWRLLLRRIAHDWYDIKGLTTQEEEAIDEAERIIDHQVLKGRRIYEGLSRLQAE